MREVSATLPTTSHFPIGKHSAVEGCMSDVGQPSMRSRAVASDVAHGWGLAHLRFPAPWPEVAGVQLIISLEEADPIGRDLAEPGVTGLRKRVVMGIDDRVAPVLERGMARPSPKVATTTVTSIDGAFSTAGVLAPSSAGVGSPAGDLDRGDGQPARLDRVGPGFEPQVVEGLELLEVGGFATAALDDDASPLLAVVVDADDLKRDGRHERGRHELRAGLGPDHDLSPGAPGS
jgi:hypothetical protein